MISNLLLVCGRQALFVINNRLRCCTNNLLPGIPFLFQLNRKMKFVFIAHETVYFRECLKLENTFINLQSNHAMQSGEAWSFLTSIHQTHTLCNMSFETSFGYDCWHNYFTGTEVLFLLYITKPTLSICSFNLLFVMVS